MHKEGFPASSIGKMIGHYTRGLYDGQEVEYPRNAGGGHIDRSRTGDNYQLGECHGAEWVRERLKNVYSRPQDVNKPKMIDIVVTLPQDEPKENARAFFEASYRSLCKQFQKKNNIVGAWVHLDEAQPHMHFAFLPIIDRTMKKNPEVKESISQKAYFPAKASLQAMHKTTQKDVSEALGHRVALLNGITKAQGGNKSISQLKTESQQVLDQAMQEKRGFQETRNAFKLKKPWFGDDYYKVTPGGLKSLVRYAKAGAEATASEKERQEELRNARAKEKQADEELKAVKIQLAKEKSEGAALRQKLSEAEILLDAPPAEKKELETFMAFKQHQFRDFADSVNREAVRAFAEAGQKVEPVLDTMGRAFEAVGVATEDIEAHLRLCVMACKQQAKRFFKCREKGQEYRPPERVKSWYPAPEETDYSQQDEAPPLMERLQKLVMFKITGEKINLFQHFHQEEVAKARSKGKGQGFGKG